MTKDVYIVIPYNEMIGAFSSFIMIVTMLVYIRSIITGQTKPHIFTWIVWDILALIALGAQISEGVASGIWPLASWATLCSLTVLLSLKFGEKNFTRSDLIFLALALLSIAPWLLLKDPLMSVVIICIINLAGFIPTFRKSWHCPDAEKLSTYFASACAMLLSLAALETLNPTTILYPLTVASSNFVFVTLTLYRRKINPPL